MHTGFRFSFLLSLIIALCFSLMPAALEAQTRAEDQVDWYNIDYEFAKALLLERINKERKRKRMHGLVENDQLYVAADRHNKWQIKVGKISHKERKGKSETPVKRVHQVSKDWIRVGENLLRLDYAFDKDERGMLFRQLSYKELTDKMYSLWRKSKGHYKNLIRKEFDYCGTAIEFDMKKKRVYVTQVYGSLEH